MKLHHRSLAFLLILLFGAAALALPAPAAQAQPASKVWYVAQTSRGTGSCDSWENACALQQALSSAAAGSGDELWVEAGVYRPTTTGDDPRTATFQLKSGVALYGGFTGNESHRDARDWVANETILSGDIGVQGVATDNVYHVVTGSGTDHTAVLDGFTVTGGYAAYIGSIDCSIFCGGGMRNSSGSPTIRNVTFRGNHSVAGGGMSNEGSSSPTLEDVIFSKNTAEYGGGMANLSSSPELINVAFSDNAANSGGGGIYNDFSSPTLTHVVFSGNKAIATSGSSGGGMYNYISSPKLTGVTFSSNESPGGGGMYNAGSSPELTGVTFDQNSAHYGGGMFNADSNPALVNVTFSGNAAIYYPGEYGGLGGGLLNSGSSPTLTNVTFSDNTAYKDGGGMYNSSSSPTIINAIFWGNTADDGEHQIHNQYTDSQPKLINSIIQGNTCPYHSVCTGNMDTDPLLGPLGDWGGATPTISLLPGSPAIDAGDNDACPETDQRGVERPAGFCDIGAFESQGFTLEILSGDGQSAPIGGIFAAPLRVRVRSAFNEPVDGGFVTFRAPISGAGATFTVSQAPISGGMASLPVAANGFPGSYQVTASAAGAASPVSFHLANKVTTQLSLASSLNPSLHGQAVTFTAAVTSDAGTPTGSVQFKVDGKALGDPVALVSGVASYTTRSLSLGTHAVTAEYSGDDGYFPSSGALDPDQTVNPWVCYIPFVAAQP